jgi:outer membrane protein OmpA-like peptidoglycan-associated protein/peptidoglycan hydrolase-like protein with peptidoglycan-binding domain
VGDDSFHLPGGDILRKMLGGNPEPPKEAPPTAKRLGGAGAGKKPSASSAPAEKTEEALPLETAAEPKDKKPKVILRNPKWEAEDVGFNEETEISVEAEIPPELATKTAVLFELSAKAPSGPERISQADGFVEDGKAKTMIPVFQPQYREEDGSVPAKVEYQFTAKHSHSDLLKDDKAIRIVDHMAERVIDTHILQDITFALDKSFVRAQECEPIKEMFRRIRAWQEDHPDAKMAVFGHTDALGDEPYNKTLSEKRAKAIHALLVKEPKTWLALYDEEKWGLASTQEYLKHLGHDPGAIDGQDGPKTQAAVKEFQESKGLAATGKADAGTREALYVAFMESCEGFKVEDKKFDSIDGAPFMGCSEFNLVKQTQGAEEANRRVAVFLLKSNKNFPISYPCKKKDLGPCKQQVARKGERRTKGFSCFFYDKLVDESAVRPVPGPKGKAEPQILVDAVAAPPAPAEGEAAAGPAVAPAEQPAPAGAPAGAAGPENAAPAPEAPKAKAGAPGDAVPDPVLAAKLVALVAHPGSGAAAVALKLKTDIAYDGTGLFTRSDANIDFFRKGSAAALKFDGADNKFTGAQLTAGVDLEARGVKASAKAEEIT